MSPAALVFGDEALPHWCEDIRRYCGLSWPGGPPEVWAYPYFDAEPSAPDDVIRPADVLRAAALHPGLTRENLAYFIDHGPRLSTSLGSLPADVDLADAGPEVVARVQALSELADPTTNLALISKVLHIKRPRLVPMLDRTLVDHYRSRLQVRGATAWKPLVRALADDLRAPGNHAALISFSASVTDELETVPAALRLADIAIWMHHTVRTHPGKTRP